MKRKYLSGEEVTRLLQAVSTDIPKSRDYCMISMAFWHGLRVSELLSLTLEDYDPLAQSLHIRRLKGGLSTTHPLHPDAQQALQRWLQERKRWPGQELRWLFLSRQGGKLSRQRFYQLLRTYGQRAHLPLPVHPHMLRHACGYALAERGNDTRLIQDYLGHRNIRHTVLYTAANAARFIRAWDGIQRRPWPPPADNNGREDNGNQMAS
ncbi:TPA: tyrosine-type DNA invertase [Serratia marcescens]|uniref:tyrosine-type DNA invertase n=1 Tax=Serratia marcescens TaxID=615 RepID=UPI000E02D6C2|nr:tyrosine-type DNA invertase [Serratia marcescens]SUJ36032.1 Tyrosine recombinase XerC [Serratia marcescens]